MENPQVAVLFLTPACNMRCSFCGSDEGFEPMGWIQAVSLLQKLKAEGATSVVLGGGEPFLWSEDPVELASIGRRLGLHMQVGTNVTGAPRSSEALRAFDRWVLPIESMSEEVHNHMRPLPHDRSHLKTILSHLEDLRRARVEATISSLVSAKNFDDLLDVGDYLRSYVQSGGRLHAWHLYRFLPLGRGGSLHAADFLTSPEVYAELGILLKARFPDLKIYRRPDMYHSKSVTFYWSEKGALKTLESLPALA